MSQQKLSRQLKQHHLQLMAIGGVIGAGFFMGAGKTISLAGPSVLAVYAIVGLFVFFTMRAMGELLLSNENYGSFLDAIYDYLGDFTGFLAGWTYWLCWLVVAIANTVAVVGYLQFWQPDISVYLPILANIGIILLLNLLPVKWFGQAELGLTLIKIATILLLIAIGGYLVFSGFVDQSGHKASLSNLYNQGNLMPNGWPGFFAAFQLAVQASVGAEMIGAAAAETDNPAKNLPAAINRIPIRIALFFILSLSVIMAVIPLERINSHQSPFVMMFGIIGMTMAAGFVNVVAICAALSSANSGIYSSARMIYTLANQDSAPKIFRLLNRHGTPVASVLYSALYLTISFGLLQKTDSVMQAFSLISTISSIGFLVIWGLILVTYLTYRRQRPELHKVSRYRLPYGRVLSLISLGFFGLVLCMFGQQPDTAAGLKWSPVWFGLLVLAYPVYRFSIKQSNLKNLKHRSP